MSVAGVLGRAFDLEAVRAERAAHLAAFLDARGLDASAVAEVVAERFGERAVVLFTSSPVHGLANPTSDIDLITVADELAPGPRMATQIFHAGAHLENIAFSAEEVDAGLDDLAALAALAPPDAVARLGAWDRGHELRRKYLERLVNGVTPGGEMPYARSLGALAAAWTASSLEVAIRAAALAGIAERAGERRGPLAYALDAALHAMDAVLSAHGEVYSNKKWYLLRWRRRLAAGGQPLDRTSTAAVGELTAALARAAREPGATPLGDACAGAIARVCAAIGAPAPAPALAVAAGVEARPLLPGSRIALDPRGAALPIGDGLELEAGAAVPVERLDPTAARDALRLARAGMAEVRAW